MLFLIFTVDPSTALTMEPTCLHLYTKDSWGLKNFGINYGIVFTAWGVGGFIMGRLSQMLYSTSGNYNSSFITAGVLLIIAGILALTLKEKK